MVKAKKFWNMKKADKTGEIYIYGDIVSYKWDDSDVTAKSFKDDLDALDDIDTLNIYINQPAVACSRGRRFTQFSNGTKRTKTSTSTA